MTEADLSALTASLPGLIEKAEAATPGLWTVEEGSANSHCFDDNIQDEVGYGVAFSNGNDAKFIAAANPQTVSRLAKALMQVMKERDEAWQPINTAPTDGSPFLGYFRELHQHGRDGKLQGMPYQICWWGTIVDDDAGWVMYGVGRVTVSPELWLPIAEPSLPKRPAPATQETK